MDTIRRAFHFFKRKEYEKNIHTFGYCRQQELAPCMDSAKVSQRTGSEPSEPAEPVAKKRKIDLKPRAVVPLDTPTATSVDAPETAAGHRDYASSAQDFAELGTPEEQLSALAKQMSGVVIQAPISAAEHRDAWMTNM